MTHQSQYLQALDKANEVRLARAAVLRCLRAGELTVEQVLEDWSVANMPVFDVLLRQYRWGRARARRVIVAAKVSEMRKVKDLTPRQKEAVLACLHRGENHDGTS